jgi:hypothetical protein
VVLIEFDNKQLCNVGANLAIILLSYFILRNVLISFLIWRGYGGLVDEEGTWPNG